MHSTVYEDFEKFLNFLKHFYYFKSLPNTVGFKGERVNPNVMPRRISTRLCFPLHLSHPPSIAYFSQCSCHKVTTLIQVHCTYEKCSNVSNEVKFLLVSVNYAMQHGLPRVYFLVVWNLSYNHNTYCTDSTDSTDWSSVISHIYFERPRLILSLYE